MAPAEGTGGLAPSPDIPLDQLMVRRWSTDDGLPSNALNRVVQAGDGFLWISSFAGLSRFDGLSFTNFDRRSLPALATDGFTALHTDAEGTLWIGTQASGIWLAGRHGPAPLKPSLGPTDEMISMEMDLAGDLWIGFEDPQLVRYRSGRATVIDEPLFDDISVSDILATDDGSLWFATRGRGVVRFVDGAYTDYTTTHGLPSNEVNGLVAAPDGSVWVGTAAGAARLDFAAGGSVRERGEESLGRAAPVFTAPPGLQGVVVQHLLFDDRGSLWLTTDRGLMRRGAQRAGFEVLSEVAGVPLNDLRNMTFDHEGSLWLTSASQGLFQLRQGKFVNLTSAQGLPAKRVNGMFEDAVEGILIGTDDGAFRLAEGLAEPGSWRVEPWDLGVDLGSVKVLDFFRDRRDRLWVSTYSGLVLMDGEDRRVFTEADGLPSRQVRWTRQSLNGDVWCGTIEGFARLSDDGSFRVPEVLGPFAYGLAFSMTEAPDGTLYFGTREGLVVVDPADGTRQLYEAGDVLPSGGVFDSYLDADGDLWISSPGGLARLRPDGSVATLDSSKGLPRDSVYDVREDASGYLWMASVVGVLRARKADVQAFMEGDAEDVGVQIFDEHDGMVEEECLGARKMSRTADGSLWFPTLGGLSVIAPEHFPVNPVAPPVWVTDFETDGEALRSGDETVIPAGRRRVSVGFAALSFRAPERVEVRYRLEGFDAKWSRAEGERRISYTNLPPGHYTLRVQAANNDGLWNTQGAAAVFYVEPRIYQTWWFYGLVLATLAMVVWVSHRWRVGGVQRHNTQLELDAVERSHLIDQLAAKNRELELFAYTASHDLKSPLVTIEGFLGLLEQDALAGDHQRMQKDLQRIRGGIQTMGQLLDGLLEVSRIGRTDDTTECVGLTVLAQRALESLDSQVVAGGASVEIEADLPMVLVSPSRLIQVFQNFIANGIKFSGDAAPDIYIDQRRDGGETVIYVRDRGVGIAAQFHHKVFGLFDRLDPSVEGSGLGLAIVQRIIEHHGGRVWVESEGAGQGSTFCFTLAASKFVGG